MNHKHYLFRVLDKMPEDQRPHPLDLYLKALMMYYVAENKLQRDMRGDEMEYIRMLTQEYVENS